MDGMLADWGVSIRRACKVLPFDTSSYHYKSRRTDQAGLERRIKEIAETRVRYGYPLADGRMRSNRLEAPCTCDAIARWVVN